MTDSYIMVDNHKTKVTLWTFEPSDETVQHIHEYDYVIAPLENVQLKILDQNKTISFSNLKKGNSYFRKKVVNHNVKNNNVYPYSFLEIQFK